VTKNAKSGPLDGLRVIEIANVVAGPTCCQVLGDFGAEIIKIEHPDGGDGMRRMGNVKDGTPLWWKVAGRNKRSVGMYLGDPEAAEIFLELVKTADVVVESFRPGTLEKWGIGYERMRQANPKLILLRISGFGQSGPYAERPAFGTLVESMTGFAHLTGEPDGPPTLPPLALADYMAGYSGVAAVMMALYHRDARGGDGQVIDLTVFEPLMSTMALPIVRYDQLGIAGERTGNRSINTAPRNTYRTKDGKWIGVSAATNELAARIVRLVGRPDLAEEPWFKTGKGRAVNVEILDEAVAKWMLQRDRDEIMVEAAAASVTFAPVYSIPDLMADAQVLHRDMITTIDDADLGPLRMPNLLYKMSETPGAIKWGGPELGTDTQAVLGDEMGVSDEKLKCMRDRKAVY
jgi:crotonobetainyl-CoA:carnitine CoA-transferase CaiB-like acyl-CoA transferase